MRKKCGRQGRPRFGNAWQEREWRRFPAEWAFEKLEEGFSLPEGFVDGELRARKA
jgi:hypothetical protein